ncbi:MAG: NMD protein affecting ribosome stability and mRNA decay [Candidatus Methanohalarchaeum thermophilum]|uniref:NMD protein affecting ribosome stability and mRNA decay n=1 Tax=Methanohalarchaeum thermophilum TaxID=1903181 RepID=A0A1Q6DW87_METT1|nr:MAG: NMD protein affecting ribosome stability and mRNA decay [Candidatus Methanohalarchaeum thermophilum]
MNKFCPKCGKEKERFVGKICLDCFIEEEDLVFLPDELEVEFCPKCGSFKDGSTWKKIEGPSKAAAAESAVMSNLRVHRSVKDLDIKISSRSKNDHIDVILHIFGVLRGQKVRFDEKTNVKLNKVTCKRCNKIENGYFESKVQLRGKNRDLSEKEREKIGQMINQLTNTLSEENRMSFISEISEKDGGLDIFTGTTDLARKISNNVIEKFGGSYSKSSTLIGMKDGQEVHRISFSVRLPSFTVGDVVRLKEKILGIIDVGKVISAVNLRTGKKEKIPWKKFKDEEVEKIGSQDDFESAVISLVTENEVQIIEPNTHKNVSLKRPNFIKKRSEGSNIKALKNGRNWILIPKKFA